MKEKQVVQANPFHIINTTLVKYRGHDEQITIPGAITEIGDLAFLGCNELRCVHIPDTVRVIGANAFQACRNLETVVISGKLEELGSAAFSGCISLKEIHFPGALKSIPIHLCYGCTALETISIPDTVKKIGWKAFFGCGALKSVKLPGALQWIGEEAFSGCEQLTEMSLPDSVVQIDQGAFYNCKSLRALQLPSHLAAIPQNAFSGCAIKHIEIPECVKKMDFTAFENCPELTMVVIHAEHCSITNYGNGDQVISNAPLFFSKPHALSSALRRNMFRGYARIQLMGNTTPAIDEIYNNYYKENMKHVCQWALADPPLLEYLMRDRLIPPGLAEELIQDQLQKNRNEQAAVLVNYLGQVRPRFDPTEVFDLGN